VEGSPYDQAVNNHDHYSFEPKTKCEKGVMRIPDKRREDEVRNPKIEPEE
jgi:hypothetical protein